MTSNQRPGIVPVWYSTKMQAKCIMGSKSYKEEGV